MTIAETKKELESTSALNFFKRRELQATLDAAIAEKKAAKAVIYKHKAIAKDETHPWMVEAKKARDRARPIRAMFDTLTHENSREVWIQDSYLQVAAPRIVSEVGEHPEELAKGRTLAERIRAAIDALQSGSGWRERPTNESEPSRTSPRRPTSRSIRATSNSRRPVRHGWSRRVTVKAEAGNAARGVC